MPYASNADLPDSVTHVLPDHAQTIFRSAFNAALKEYGDDTRARQTAWSAVKKAGYTKQETGKWQAKNAFA